MRYQVTLSHSPRPSRISVERAKRKKNRRVRVSARMTKSILVSSQPFRLGPVREKISVCSRLIIHAASVGDEYVERGYGSSARTLQEATPSAREGLTREEARKRTNLISRFSVGGGSLGARDAATP